MRNRNMKMARLTILAVCIPDSASPRSKPIIKPEIIIQHNRAYFIHRRYLSPFSDFLLKGKGILKIQSCKNENGQILQMINLPKIRHIAITTPKM
jgi:hypothetical protein